MSTRRWDVEIKPNSFEDVGADSVAIEAGGVLAFRTGDALTVAYAPGAWRTVTLSEHES